MKSPDLNISMSEKKQIFTTDSPLRWKAFQWAGRLLLLILLVMIPVIIITLVWKSKPQLPGLSTGITIQKLNNPVTPKGFTKDELKKYKGYADFLLAKRKNEHLISHKESVTANRIRSAFYVEWDPQSFYSLQKNIDKLNMVLPEWFFIDPVTDTLRPSVDAEALALMKQHNVKIVPIINNINEDLGEGQFDGNIIHRILHHKEKRERLINDIIKYLQQYQLQGINIDFEEFKEKSDEPIIAFQKELYEKLHEKGLLVTQDIMPENEEFNVKELAKFNDYIFLMAYDQYYSTSIAGPVSAQRWIERTLDEVSTAIPSGKIILCMAAYGYDWPAGEEATTLTYQQAMATAKENHATIDFDNDTYNDHFSYTDGSATMHQVFFTDAVTNFNTIRFADEYGTAGTAVWRLGSEDERLWTFYNRDLCNDSILRDPFDFSVLQVTQMPAEEPDYIGDGEILNVVSEPTPGKMQLEIDSAENIISEQRYLQLPSRYVIRKYGNVKNQVILTFDDGPDAEYTPAILDILKKEKVPATFFVIGVNAEENLPLLKRIYKEGHEIGNHTFTHPNIAEVSTNRALTEMESTRLLIEAVIGRSTVLFRAPYNADAEPTKEVELKPVALSRDNNYYTVGESIDPNDWDRDVTADSIYSRVVRQYEANPSKGIILLHDAGGNRSATVAALPKIIQYFKARGVEFSTVGKLLNITPDQIMPPVKGKLLKIDREALTAWFWFSHFMTAAFWIAIFLGLFKITWMSSIAIWQFRKSKKEKILLKDVIFNPPVSIIVPAYNEEVNAVNTVTNLLQQDYPSLEIIFVDDGSKDGTFKKISAVFNDHPQVKVFTKPNGGKASALNFGIAQSNCEYVICIDADTQLKHDAVTQLMKYFSLSKSIGAVAGNVKVGNVKNVLTRWQSIEYITAQNFDRRAFDLINGITVVPGAIGAFKREAIEKAGGFTTDTLAEDCDLTIRVLRAGYTVRNCTEAIAVTEAPETLKQFMKQRFRWSYGIMQSFWKNRDACFKPKYKSLGLVALPNVLVFQILLPILAPLADAMLVFSLIWNKHNPDSLHKIGLFYGIFLLLDLLVGILAFSFEKEKPGKLIWIIPQRSVYRQLMYIILFRAIKKAIKGESQGWGVLTRTGNVKQVTVTPG